MTDLAIRPLLARWEPERRPRYEAILAALSGAMAAGELQPGDQLPPQRALAAALGVDLTTVTRAYSLAAERGLVEGTTGRGTFVSARALQDDPGVVDLSMNLPPPPEGLSFAKLLAETTTAVLQRSDAATLMAYHPDAGTPAQKLAAAGWLEPVLGPVASERVLVAPGAQAALTALLMTLTKPGDLVVTEPLTYPGFKAVAAGLGLRLVACPGGGEGLALDALAKLLRERRPAALYLIPTLQNPTARTLPLEQRRAVAALAQEAGVPIIEDDPYSPLVDAPLPAVSRFAPETGYYLSTLSKCLSPGLRLAYLVCPDQGSAERVSASLRAAAQMPPPLTAAVACQWMRDGTAMRLVEGVRREARARRTIAAALLPAGRGAAESLHIWLDLSPGKAEALAKMGRLALVGSKAFAVGSDHPEGVRISLGGPAKREVLAAVLENVARLLKT